MTDRAASVDYQETFVKNSRGVSLFTCRWVPRSPIKALLFLCHTYGTECSHYMREAGFKIAGAGFAVFGIDYEGHGRSPGSRGYIKNFEILIDDCENHFMAICEKENFRGKERFLFGDAMGGTVALVLHLRHPLFWQGAVLIAPLCRLPKDILPSSKMMLNLMEKIDEFLPKMKCMRIKDVLDSAIKDPVKREMVRNNTLIYQGKPRIKTLTELARITSDLQEALPEVTLPFIVLHGAEDTVVDQDASRALHEHATSKDKTIKVYPTMWHSLLIGEPEENVNVVLSDIISWLDQRCLRTDEPNQIVEQQQQQEQEQRGKQDIGRPTGPQLPKPAA